MTVSTLLAALLLLGWPADSALAATITVNDPNDSNGPGVTCTLRRAVLSINAGTDVAGCVNNGTDGYGTNDTIIVPAGTYVLSNSGANNDATAGDLDLNRSVTIIGAGARTTIIDGEQALSEDRVFEIGPMGPSTVSISGVTVTDGGAGATNGSVGGGLRVWSGSSLVLTDSIVAGNFASEAGAGIASEGDLTIIRSQISGNEINDLGGDGGGVAVLGGDARIVNSTFSGNSADDQGGAFYQELGITLIAHTTFSGNVAPGTGAAIYANGGLVSSRANVFAVAGTTNCVTGGGTYTSLGGNVSGDGTCGGTGTDAVSSVAINLGPLANNGGPTDTHRLQAGSVAIDFVQAPCTEDGTGGGMPVTVDQRNESRPIDGAPPAGALCDSGAFEAASPGQLQFSTTTYSVAENVASGVATVVVQRVGGSTGAVGATVRPSNGVAIAPDDFASADVAVAFADGDTADKNVTIPIVNDLLDEPDEPFNVDLISPTGGASLGGTTQATVTIQDDDPPPTISIADAPAVTEGNAGTVLASFDVTLSVASAQTVTAQAQTADGTATAGADYTATGPTTITFTPGTVSQTFTVPVLGDTVNEANETFVVNLTGPTNASIADGQGAASITDDDALSVSIDDGDVTEGNSGSVNLAFIVTLNRPSGQTVTVQAQTADNGSATAGADYTATGPTTLTFTPGTTSQTFAVPVLGDTLDEPNETFVVNLTNLNITTNATILDAQGLGTIVDDDGAPGLSVADVSLAEGNSGTTSFVFTVSLLPASAQTVTVQAQTADGTATTADADYTATGPTTLTFAPGVTSQTFTVPVPGDTRPEADETFLVNLSAATNATIVDAQATGMIENDDQVAMSISDVTLAEGNSGTTSFVFSVSLDRPGTQTVTVQAQTADGTATVADADYTATGPTTLTFAPGVTSQSFTVPVRGDTVFEPDERFFVNLTGATNATVSDGQGVGTIQNDDSSTPAPAPGLSIGDVTLPEGSLGTTDFRFTVTLDRPSVQTVTVQVQTVDGTAVAGSDYAALAPQSVTFAAGTTAQTVTVRVNGDTVVEADETFVVRLSGATNATIADAEGLGTIVNDDGDTPVQGTPSQPENPANNDSSGTGPKKEKEDGEGKLTEEEQQQQQLTNASNRDDVSIEGNVVEVYTDETPPYVMIANRDGLVKVVLYKDAATVAGSIRVGDYLEASGEKQHEQLFDAYDVSITRGR